MTSYIIVRAVDVPDDAPARYELVNGGIDGHGDLDAVRRARRLLPEDEQAGTFYAIPARSFHRHNCEMKTVQRELWS